jgi:hypothetical protein
LNKRNRAHGRIGSSIFRRSITSSLTAANGGVDRELQYADLDGDGVYEISQAVPAFVFFEDLTNATSHLIDVAFKYDPKTRQYLPANQILQPYSLAGIEDEINGLDKSDTHKFTSDVLLIVLRYIYAGKRKEAWSFYNREYNLPDKERLPGKYWLRCVVNLFTDIFIAKRNLTKPCS